MKPIKTLDELMGESHARRRVMSRKIYILFFGVHYESENILAVYSDINEARDHLVAESHSVDDIKIKEDKMSSDNGCCYYRIEEHEVAGGWEMILDCIKIIGLLAYVSMLIYIGIHVIPIGF